MLQTKRNNLEELAKVAKPLSKEEMKAYVGGGVRQPDMNCMDIRFCEKAGGGTGCFYNPYWMDEVVVIGHNGTNESIHSIKGDVGINVIHSNPYNTGSFNMNDMGLGGLGSSPMPTLGSAANPYTEKQFENLIDSGQWNGGYVDTFGSYVGKETVIKGDFMQEDKWKHASDLILGMGDTNGVLKESLFKLVGDLDKLDKGTSTYLKISKTVGKTCGYIGLGISVIDWIDKPTGTKTVKLLFNITANMLGPEVGLTYNVIESTGSVDKLAYIINNELDRSISMGVRNY